MPIEPLESALEHENQRAREQAAKALYAVSITEPERVLDTLSRLVSLLESDRSTLRTKVVATVATAGAQHPNALSPHTDALADSLADESAMVQKSAIEALGHVAVEDPAAVIPAVPRVLPLLDADLESTRYYATAVLEAVATEHPDVLEATTVVEPLLEVLEDPYEPPSDVTFDPKMAAGTDDPTHQLQGYRPLVVDEQGRSSNVRARERAAATVAAVTAADPVSVVDVLDPHLPRLFDLMADRNPAVRGGIVSVLVHVAEVNPAAVEPAEADLIDALDDGIVVGVNAVWALRYVGSQRALEALRATVDDDDVTIAVRTAAEDALTDLDS